MRYLGIDYGKKRIGLALSDAEGRIAFPHSVVHRLEEVLALIRKENAESIVVGLPLHFSGKAGEQAAAVKAFAAELEKAVQLPVSFENEMFTTKIAERHTALDKADAAAAALILQSYLDKQLNPSA